MIDEYEDNYDECLLSEEDLFQIQDEYRRQKLKENLIGPLISTVSHVILVALLFVFAVGEVKTKDVQVVIHPVQEDIPKEDPPPPPPPPELPPPEPTETVSLDTTVTSMSEPDASELIGALDDVSDEPPSTDDSAEANLVSDVKPNASSVISSKMYGGRTAAGRRGAMKTYGAGAPSQQSLVQAMKWLAKPWSLSWEKW